MIAFLKSLFEEDAADNGTPEDQERQCRLASAALLVEVASIDDQFAESERNALLKILTKEFNLIGDELAEIEKLAIEKQSEASSLHEFTSLINEHFAVESKIQLIVNMWRIAYADGELDKYEEYIIRRVSELIYVAHGDFIRAKQIARSETGNDKSD